MPVFTDDFGKTPESQDPREVAALARERVAYAMQILLSGRGVNAAIQTEAERVVLDFLKDG